MAKKVTIKDIADMAGGFNCNRFSCYKQNKICEPGPC